MTTPVANISFSFQLSGLRDGVTLSFDIAMIVPDESILIRLYVSVYGLKLGMVKFRDAATLITIVEYGYDEHHEWREVVLPYRRQKNKPNLQPYESDTKEDHWNCYYRINNHAN